MLKIILSKLKFINYHNQWYHTKLCFNMNLDMCGLPPNMNSSSQKTWQTVLLFLKPLQIQTLKRKKWGDMVHYIPPPEKVGDTSPVFPTKLHPCNLSWLWSRLQTTLAQIARIAPKWKHCFENFFTVHDIWEICACPVKTELPWNFSLYWIYFLHSGLLSNFALALKNRGCPEFTVLIIYFLSFWSFEQLTLSLKNGLAQKFFTVLKYFLPFRIFEQLRAWREKQGFPGIFRCIEHTSYIQDF